MRTLHRLPAHPLLKALLLASLLVLPFASMAAATGSAFFERDAFMACDNTGTCRLAAFGPSAPLMLSILFERAGGPQTAVTGRLSMAEDLDASARSPATAAPEGSVRLRVDGKDLGAIGHMEAPDLGLELPARHVMALIEALAHGRQIEMHDAAGHAWPLSGLGARTLLLKMDQVQGRAQTPGALMSKGSRSESSVPAAAAAPPLDAPPLRLETREEDARLGERADLLQLLQPVAAARQDCARESSRRLGIERVDARHVLAQLSCTRDRYNVPAGTWLIRDRPPYSPTLITRALLSPLDPHAVFVEEGVATGKEACGTTRHWVWDGTRLNLGAEYIGPDCLTPGQRHWQLPTYVTEIR
ncbi:DUF1176 domain-containing protein [Stenotrophomonas maltophilia]